MERMNKSKVVEVEEPVVEQQEEATTLDFEGAITIVSRDLIKASTDLAVGYDKKLSEVLEAIAVKVTKITE